MTTTIAKYRQVVANPFSNATNQPKLPDGKAVSSMGEHRNLVASFSFGEHNDYDIIISPRFETPIFVASVADDPAGGGALVKAPLSFNDSSSLINCWNCQTAPAAGTPQQISMINSLEVSKWRMVSQGCRITLTNSTDDNDGWFEAFRFSPNRTSGEYLTSFEPAAAAVGDSVKIKTSVYDDMFGNRDTGGNTAEFQYNMASRTNYMTGKLRNIHKYTWINKPSVNDIEFKELTSITLTNPDDKPPGAEPSTYGAYAFQDWDYDVIWIRVHGRGMPATANGPNPGANVGDGCCRPTNLMFHLAQNNEIIYGEQNVLHNYMTRAPMYKSISLPAMRYGGRGVYGGRGSYGGRRTYKKGTRKNPIYIG